MKMDLKEMAGTPDPGIGFMGRPFPIEHPRLPVLDPMVSYFSMTVRHSVDMEDFSSTRIPVDVQLQLPGVTDSTQGMNEDEFAEELGTLISVGMCIPKEISAARLCTQNSVLSEGSKDLVQPVILAPLTYGDGTQQISPTSPTDERAQRYRSSCPSPESVRSKRRSTALPNETIIEPISPSSLPTGSFSRISGSEITPEKHSKPPHVSYLPLRAALVPTSSIEITSPSVYRASRSRLPIPIPGTTHPPSPITDQFKRTQIRDSCASYDESMNVESIIGPTSDSHRAGQKTPLTSVQQISTALLVAPTMRIRW